MAAISMQLKNVQT